jgi:octaheme c-type cytochrome (tetrathionate reductase family)
MSGTWAEGVAAQNIFQREPGQLATLILLAALVTGVTSCSAPDGDEVQSGPWSRLPERPQHTDHTTFFQEPFTDGPAVTRACLECHPKASEEVMQTAHWNWQGEPVMVPGHDEPMRIGKRNVINNFCIGIQSNWPACTMCHIGYGWEDEGFDFNDQSRVDCLVCHDNSGTYLKKFRAAGLPDESVDLLAVARSVGRPLRQNCGSCHFQGGGGNAVKHGDMDETLLFPSSRIDIHMGKHDMVCIDCHRTEKHRIRGRSMAVSVDNENYLRCTDCHESRPHEEVRLNKHTGRLACQACHVPYMGPDTGTKLSWDWSEAGQDLDITDEHQYLKIKGRFTWAKKVEPEYYWYNETSTRYILGDRIDPAVPTRMSGPQGSREDPSARIWPFKVHRGKQPYDRVNGYFMVPNVHGSQGFWTVFNWPVALQLGAEVIGLPYSGEYDFAPTEMFFPLSHMVTEPDRALVCRDCHGERGRLDWQALGYAHDPIERKRVVHDPVYLMDADDVPVTESGGPVSVSNTCGMCHELEDPDFVDAHGYHASVQDAQLPPERRQLMQAGPRIPRADDESMNCFLCHLAEPDLAARDAALAKGMIEWSVTATLGNTGLVRTGGGGYVWNPEQVGEDGEVQLELGPVSEANCGACHGMVHDGSTPLLVKLGDGRHWTTETTGQVFSPQRVRLSGMNHENKDALDRVWDVHAERLVSCGDCHYARGRPARLAGDANPAEVAPQQGVRRRCESCHSLAGTHKWLPQPDRHFRAVACEACHIPEIDMAARQDIDRSVMLPDGSPVIHYRGADGDVRDTSRAYIRGYRPLLRVGRNVYGENQVMPFNMVTTWYWRDGEAPVSQAQLRKAWFAADGGYVPEVLMAFDRDGDANLHATELRLDTDARVSLIRDRLREAGVDNPMLHGEVQPYHIHHNVRHGREVSRDCDICHAGPDEQADFRLSDYLPGGVKPVMIQDVNPVEMDGHWQVGNDGGLWFLPQGNVAGSWQDIEETIRSNP